MGIFSFLRREPGKRLEQQIRAKMGQAVQLQRNGKISEYSALMGEVDGLQQQLDRIKAQRAAGQG